MLGVSGLVALKMCLLLLVAGRWGYHRDEPYYVVGGRHPAFGYVDHPPMTPWLARWSDAIFSPSLAGFRLLPALVSSSLLVVAAASVRLMGGSGDAALYAALAVLACPVLLATGHWFQTVPFDQLLGSLAMLVWLHLLGGGDQLWWLGLGLLFGLGLENKWTALLVVGAVAVGTVFSSELRPDLLSPWPWLGVVIALAVWAPNLRWQARRGWPSLRFIQENSRAARHDAGWAAFLWQQLGVLGVPLLVLVTVGLGWAWGESEWRPAVLGVVAALLGLAIMGSKPYYHGAFLPFLFAAGAVAVDQWSGGAEMPLIGAIGIWGAVAALFTLPLLPPRFAANFGIFAVNDELAEELGWPELVDQVAKVLDGLPEEERRDATVVTRSYGEAAAIELLGPKRGIPRGTALSGHNSFVEWWPDQEPRGVVIAVRFDRGSLEPFFEECERVGHVRNDLGVKNQVAGSSILVCRGLKDSPAALREALRFTR
jgi:4-amino-4-deoxy-L-arabinose transferase-like glycosyltransferase